MQDLKDAIPQVDDVAVFEKPRGRRRLDGILGDIEAVRPGVDEGFAKGVSAALEKAREPLAQFPRQQGRRRRLGQLGGLVAMRQAHVELVKAAHVVEMTVRGNGQERPVEQAVHGRAQGTDAQSRIDQEVAIPSAHVPDVAAQKGIGVRLPYQGDAVADLFPREPRIGDGDLHQGPL